VKEFLWGSLATTSAIASLMFLRYAKVTRDRIFLYFSAAFFVMMFNWIGLAVIEPNTEHRYLAYFLRLIAFVLILVGIADKNIRAGRAK